MAWENTRAEYLDGDEMCEMWMEARCARGTRGLRGKAEVVFEAGKGAIQVE
jgi:hypothetical protein